ncbi:GMC oxidoreductase [Streptomyces sp. NPDC088736]|uniref:GMC oxidoreductase n=1 Tax=Streptomyces sp. NPDC088736 TaxID=3365881 RepID=UPI0038168D3E
MPCSCAADHPRRPRRRRHRTPRCNGPHPRLGATWGPRRRTSAVRLRHPPARAGSLPQLGPADDGTGVCGNHSRVWNTLVLWVAGNNVIPTATARNPTLTSVALAVRGARALFDHLDSAAEHSTPVGQSGSHSAGTVTGTRT